jgi:SagB-type dehydrogenase family enzyme
LRLLARGRTRNQIYASLSRFSRSDVDAAIEKLVAVGVVTDDAAPVARAFHTAATRLLTPVHFLTQDEIIAKEIAQGNNSSPCIEHPLIALPKQPSTRVADLWTIIRSRRTTRRFASLPIAIRDLSDVLTLAAGVTDTTLTPRALRATPSGGALYPISIRVVALLVNDLCRGVYRYHPESQHLELLLKDISPSDVSAAIHTDGQPSIQTCAAVLILTWSWTRSVWKYGEQGYFVGLVEAGHIAQNVLIAATRLGLAAAPTIGLGAGATDVFLGLDSRQEQSLYAIILGQPCLRISSVRLRDTEEPRHTTR